MRKAAFFCNDANARNTVFGAGRWERFAGLVDMHPVVITESNIDDELPRLAEIEVALSTWGMFELSPAQLAQLPQLKALFYAAGRVKQFAAPLLGAGITVVSSWAANAVPTAEFAMAQILLANKGYHRNAREFASPGGWKSSFKGRGNFGSTVAVIGAGRWERFAARASVVSNHAANIPETVGCCAVSSSAQCSGTRPS